MVSNREYNKTLEHIYNGGTISKRTYEKLLKKVRAPRGSRSKKNTIYNEFEVDPN